ncbi:MAG: hypothetical protein ACTSXO_07670 [Candidatus Heimdallarchaeota archaeon]|nr:MAG: hypothetical protein DRP02_01450 [Candidatus Gerdarchaeota archaeon]RLI74262.1 MAG: hypothetical protein DRO91_00930 [Candidatus Heimdallarchaeota archaeon]
MNLDSFLTKDEAEEAKEKTQTIKERLTEDFGEIDPQLFIALTSRWRRQNGTLAFGVSKRQLRAKTGLTLLELETLLTDFGNKVTRLGLELVSYLIDNEEWFCLRSIYVVPNELTLDEQAVLGTIIFLIEKTRDNRRRDERPIKSAEVFERLVKRGYYSEYTLTKILRTLDAAGYIRRGGTKIRYGARTLIELSPERRQEIAERTEGMLL